MCNIADDTVEAVNVRQTYVETQQRSKAMEGATQQSIDVEVVSTVAKKVSKDPVDLPPLYGEIDPEALERLVSSAQGSDLNITFNYCGYTISIEGKGEISATEIASPNVEG